MSGRRKDGTNPRALGLSPRQLGVSPRELGTSKRQLQELTPDQRKVFASVMRETALVELNRLAND
jgi:hypothetical protein